MGNKENNKIATRNYGLAVPCELLFLSSCRLIQISTKDAYLFVSVTLICLVLCLKKKILSKMCMLYCLQLLNSVLFLTLFVSVFVN